MEIKFNFRLFKKKKKIFRLSLSGMGAKMIRLFTNFQIFLDISTQKKDFLIFFKNFGGAKPPQSSSGFATIHDIDDY